jgi:alginate O-acetyltransferase complex protein AlgI
LVDFNNILQAFFAYNEKRPLIFSEGSFWFFFAILLLGYSLIYKTRYLRSTYLLVFSLFFYYKSSGFFFFLLIFSTLVDYVLGILIGNAHSPWKRKVYVSLSVIVNLSLLSFFKYSYFIADTLNHLLGTKFEALNFLAHWANLAAGTNFDVGSIVLPVGISFFTFQTISYSVDVFRRKIDPVRNIIDFGFYVSFFPQLVAGPIVRAAEFIPQIYRKYSLSKRELGYAMFLILNGVLKKVVVSDYISLNLVDRVFASPLSFSGFENLLAIYGYAVQIYCDFSGYTDMAMGIALLLGFRLPLNFNSPYKAVSITDFWRRWHISLSSWLRDYLYIPLGGSRLGSFRTYINLLITMLLGGLWHGASLRFLVWGAIHGVSLAVHKLWSIIFPQSERNMPVWRRFLGALFTFHLVCLSWVYFRAETFSQAWEMLGQVATRFGWQSVIDVVLAYGTPFVLISLALAIHWLPISIKELYRGAFIRSHLVLKIVIILAVALLVFQFKSAELQPFIYFRF